MCLCIFVCNLRPHRRPISIWSEHLVSGWVNTEWQHQKDSAQVLWPFTSRLQVHSPCLVSWSAVIYVMSGIMIWAHVLVCVYRSKGKCFWTSFPYIMSKKRKMEPVAMCFLIAMWTPCTCRRLSRRPLPSGRACCDLWGVVSRRASGTFCPLSGRCSRGETATLLHCWRSSLSSASPTNR